jgi:hypothetical protein
LHKYLFDLYTSVKTHFEQFPRHWEVGDIGKWEDGSTYFRVRSLTATSTSEDTPGATLTKLLVSVVKHCHDLPLKGQNNDTKKVMTRSRRLLHEMSDAVPYVFPTEGKEAEVVEDLEGGEEEAETDGAGKRARDAEEKSEEEPPGQRRRT